MVLPHLLMNIRNRLLPLPPTRAEPPSSRAVGSMSASSHPETASGSGATPLIVQRSVEPVSMISKAAVIPESHPDVEEQEMTSDAEAESNDGDLESTGVGSSWVSLGPQESSE